MVAHLTARLAWHDNGWNGEICEKPICNSYCVGRHSYPGDVIARERDLATEKQNAGRPIAELPSSGLPPCTYSVNAFGLDPIKGYSNPPNFFGEEARRTEWFIPFTTVSVWPYEAMYEDDVTDERGRFDNSERARKAEEFFSKIEENRSLIFYYANYSNPFSEEESPRYVLVGVSRIREIGNHLFYEGSSNHIKERFAGGLIWARNISSHYPEEGLRLPYHRYHDDPEVRASFAVFPDNPRTCKYGARLLANDDAIGLLEQFLGAIDALKKIGDDSENWDVREDWLTDRIAELWDKRGLYPGLLNVLSLLGASKAREPARKLIEAGKSKEAHEIFFNSVDENHEAPQFGLTGRTQRRVFRQWQLQSEATRSLLRDILPRFDLEVKQMERIVSEDGNTRDAHGLPNDPAVMLDNPYLLSECYIGDSPDDTIPWGAVDRGVLPSPELGGEHLSGMEFNDARRLRALCVEQLRREPNQTFRAAKNVLAEVNTRLSYLPEWKSVSFTQRYFEIDQSVLEQALVLRPKSECLWLYLRQVYDDERDIETQLTKLSRRPDLTLDRPFDEQDWCDEILDKKSSLLDKAENFYTDAVEAQATACAAVFRRPLSVITGAAGTGKTTVICAMVNAIRQTEGDGTAIMIMAPTGKASDRVRDKFHEREIERVEISTVHSFLAKGGWLNENLTFKRKGGKSLGGGTIIVDEASMLDLSLMATLVRAIDWQHVRRFVLVGDPNQLPPIGRGRVFADTIQWLSEKHLGSIVRLDQNLRQMENKVENNGTGILRLAKLFVTENGTNDGQKAPIELEELLAQVHKGGEVDDDLSVMYWDDLSTLSDHLIKTIEGEMETHTDSPLDPEKPYELWRAAFDRNPERYQVLTPHRGEPYGVEALNEAIQSRIAGGVIDWYGVVDGITLYDKVIQFRNRPQSNPIAAYNFQTRQLEYIEVFNGQIGFVQKHGFDKDKRRFFLKRFQVQFSRKEDFGVGYGRDLAHDRREAVEENLELAYAISIHKAQGSEFNHTYILIPKSKGRTLSSELIYTALTRATKHCTLFIQGDVSTLLSARRLENIQTRLINSSLFDGFFHAVPDELIQRKDWYEEGKIHEDLAGNMVRSKSEVIIANLLHDRDIPFEYETLLKAPDGTMYLPDFTITWNGEKWYWEHWGLTSSESYRKHRDVKVEWYKKHFPRRLLETFEGKTLSQDAEDLIVKTFAE